VAGAREKTDEEVDTSTSAKIRNGNDLIVKFSWPYETRVSEVKIVEMAREIGETNDLVKDHIPTMLGHVDPSYLTCSTKPIRDFLGLNTDGARVFRVILFRRLQEIKFLDETHMLIAFLDCFFAHWALWEKDIEHGDISIGNLMCDPVTKRGVLNDFDLARLRVPDRKPSSKDNTGTLPCLALDLLNEDAFNGQVRRLYRHDAESFTWCLIYICICMKKDGNGQIGTAYPHPLSSWFTNLDSCYRSKANLGRKGLLLQFPLHQNISRLVSILYYHWMHRYREEGDHADAENFLSAQAGNGRVLKNLPSKYIYPVQARGSYKELSDREWFAKIFRLLIGTSDAIPESKEEVFLQILDLVDTLYPFATSLGLNVNESN